MATKKRVLCDTNLLLDVFDSERTGHADAIALLWYAAENPNSVELVSPVSSFKDAYYVLTRLYRSEAEARDSVEGLLGTFIQPVDMLASYGEDAFTSDEPDFEDALVRVCAEREGASVIITRDVKAFARCDIMSVSAADYLAREGFSYDEIDI